MKWRTFPEHTNGFSGWNNGTWFKISTVLQGYMLAGHAMCHMEKDPAGDQVWVIFCWYDADF